MAWLGKPGDLNPELSYEERVLKALAARIPVEEAVQRGLDLLRQAGKKSAEDKEEREEHGRSMEKWEEAWAWAYKWQERLTLDAVVRVSGPLKILEIVCGLEYDKIMFRSKQSFRCREAERLYESQGKYGMIAAVPPKHRIEETWSALTCSLNGFPDDLPEEPLMFLGKSLGMYVPVRILEAEWDKAQEAFRQAWIDALSQ